MFGCVICVWSGLGELKSGILRAPLPHRNRDAHNTLPPRLSCRPLRRQHTLSLLSASHPQGNVDQDADGEARQVVQEPGEGRRPLGVHHGGAAHTHTRRVGVCRCCLESSADALDD